MILLFLVISVFCLGIGFFIFAVINTAYGQQNASIITSPPSSTPTPTLNFIPQQAWVQTVPPQGVAQSTGDGTIQGTILPIIASAGAYILARLQGNKQVSKVEDKVVTVADVAKSNQAEILKGKVIHSELARVQFKFNPEEAAKLDDAPAIKMQTLSDDAKQFAQKAATTSLPTHENDDD
jgi:hypothetical protein